jgi:pimeloyl-ACP methyl ester carboxylesterase
LTEKESAELYERWTIPSPGRPLFEAAIANFSPNSPAKVNTANADRGPLLLVTGGKDHTVPPAITKSTLKLHQKSAAVTELKEFPDRGHSLTIDNGWRAVAESSLDWLRSHSIV